MEQEENEQKTKRNCSHPFFVTIWDKVINRKKKIILIQFVIFLVALTLLYNTYRNKNEIIKPLTKVDVDVETNVNSFNDVQYSGFDLNGNRYTLIAGKANFKTETPEAINMENVEANFYLKDDSILKVVSDKGLYNNISLDMKFKKNVKTTYLTNKMFSDRLNYLNSSGKLIATGNVRGESVEKGNFFADNAEYDLSSKMLNFSMFNKKRVNVKLKN
jgi:hypothetical protein